MLYEVNSFARVKEGSHRSAGGLVGYGQGSTWRIVAPFANKKKIESAPIGLV